MGCTSRARRSADTPGMSMRRASTQPGKMEVLLGLACLVRSTDGPTARLWKPHSNETPLLLWMPTPPRRRVRAHDAAATH
ncbi:hypothetical protein MRX96_033038 [Rhipicephalus microplus]